MEVNGDQIYGDMGYCLVTRIFQTILFCVQQKKETYTGLEQLKGE